MLFWQTIFLFVLFRLLLGPIWNNLIKWPPIPHQFISIYTSIFIAALFVYVTSDEGRMKSFLSPIVNVLAKPDHKLARTLVYIAFPAVLGIWAYSGALPKYEAPAETRTVHPDPPLQFKFHEAAITTQTLENPFRKDEKENPAKFNQEVMEGAGIYYQNCFYCHGDNLDGKGPFHDAFNPEPANFTDSGTLSILQENYVFWRVATGGPGLPSNSKPWNSAMPVWQNMLSKEEIWKAILWIYKGSNSTPRTFAQ